MRWVASGDSAWAAHDCAQYVDAAGLQVLLLPAMGLLQH